MSLQDVLIRLGLMEPSGFGLGEGGVLSVHVVQATNLPTTAASKPPDAYVRCRSAAAPPAQTRAIGGTSNPWWNETLQLRGELDEMMLHPLLISVRHRSTTGKPSTPKGSAPAPAFGAPPPPSAAHDETLGDLVLEAHRLAELRQRPVELVDCPIVIVAAPPNDPSPDRHSKLSFTGAASLTLTLTWRADAVDAASGSGRRSPPSSAPRPRRNLMAHLFSPQRMSTEASAGGWQQLLDDDDDAGETDRLSEAGTLEVVVRSASGLLAVDPDGMSDPYVSVVVGSLAPWSSQVVAGSLEPRWNESYRAKGRLGELIAAPMSVRVLDRDRFDSSTDELLGELSVDLSQLLSTNQMRIDRAALGAGGDGTISLDVRWLGSSSHGPRDAAADDAQLPPLERCLASVGRAGEAVDRGVEWLVNGCRRFDERLAMQGTLDVTVHSADELDGTGLGGACEAYVMVRLGQRPTWRSEVAPQSEQPSWQETYRVHGVLGELLAEPLALKVVDAARRVGLGGVNVPLDGLRLTDTLPAAPRGLPLESSPGGRAAISVSVRWTAGSVAPPLRPRPTPPRAAAAASAAAASPVSGGRAAAGLAPGTWCSTPALTPSISASPPPSALLSTPPELAYGPHPGEVDEGRYAEVFGTGSQTVRKGWVDRREQRGTLEVTLLNASGLDGALVGSAAPYPYASLALARHPTWRSAVRSATAHPEWGQVYSVDGVVADLLAAPMVLQVVHRAPDTGVEVALGGLQVRLDALYTCSTIAFFDQPLSAPHTSVSSAPPQAVRGVVSFTATFIARPEPPAPLPPLPAALTCVGGDSASIPPFMAPTSASSSPPTRSAPPLIELGPPPPISAPLPLTGGGGDGGFGGLAGSITSSIAGDSLPPSMPPSPRQLTAEAAARKAMRGTLEVLLVRAAGLSAADGSDSALDPYVTLKMRGHKTWRSSVQQKTSDPSWDETWRCEGSLGEFVSGVLQLKVFDRDFMDLGDDRLGNKRISLKPLVEHDRLELADMPLDDAASGTITLVVRFESEEREAGGIAL